MSTELLYKYISGNASASEKRLVTEWLAESDEHMREYISLRKLYNVSIWQSETIVHDVNTTIKSKRMFWIGFIRVAVAASVLLALFFRWFGMSDSTIKYQTMFVPAGQRAELILVDGTKVWLNSRSEFTFPTDFKGDYRMVKLNGEGYFNVSKDTEHPFIVETSKYDIKVLGTEFNVCAYSEEIHWETALLEGKVEILSLGKKTDGIVMAPQTKLTLKDGTFIKSKIHSDEYYRWREGLICFTDISLYELFEKLELYYEVDFLIKNEHIMKNRYTGKFRTSDGIIHVLNVLKLDNHFDYTRDEENNVITIH